MATRSFRRFVEQELGTFPHFVLYAVLEWVLIILLFIDGFLAFLSNEFAKFFELHSPCLLCTRIDHVLVRRNPNFYYNDSICEGHKKDISSLAYCHVHRKLSDIRNMCEGCLLSFATEKESDIDTYKSLVGILHKDIDCFVEEDQKIFLKSGKKDANEGLQLEKSDVLRCSCCGDPLKVRASSSSTAKTYARSSSIRSIAPTPSPRASMMWRTEDGKNLDLPHIRYTELKFMSDNESELPEDEYGLNAEIKQSREDVKSATMPLLADTEEIADESLKTPNFIRGNRFFGIPLSDSASASPRFSNRLSRKLPLEKSDLLSDLNDTNIPSNETTEGDSILHHLKRQVRLDRKSLMALYMELDEERSASAVAANNAMAMITRLQAEKAAVQMEALQYQRMMEEQAEYDQEALQVMKDLLVKREEDIKVLEADLDAYRDKYGEIRKVGSDDCEADGDDYQDMKSQSVCSYEEKSDCGSPTENDNLGENEGNSGKLGDNGKGSADVSSLDFESERSHLFGLLTNLEQKINSSPSEEEVDQETEVKGYDNKATLTREVSLIRERLRAIEAESGFLKHTAMTLQKGGEGTKLLTEIAQHLRKLRRSDKAEETTEAA